MEAIDIVNLVLGFLGTSIGISLLVYFYKQGKQYADETPNKIDDVVFDIIPEAVDFVIQNYELGEVEAVLENWLDKLENTDKDTTELEEIIKAKEEEVKK